MTTIATMPPVDFSEAKNKLSALTTQANRTGSSFIIKKNRKPWVEVSPLAVESHSEGSITITPVHREVPVPDIDALFASYEGDFIPREDGFTIPAGNEAL